MYNKIISIFIISFFSFGLFAQNCTIRIDGTVIDEATNLPLPFVNVIIQELSIGAITDDGGKFAISNICAGEYHLIVSHIGCEAKESNFYLSQDTVLNFAIAHTSISLEGIVVEGKSNYLYNQAKLSISKEFIEDNANQNLATLLENQTGIHVLRNGSGLAKPIVNGMFGNRLTILNNGIEQSGQQWGNDHSPEIDPTTADRITILKGTNAIEYGGGNLGSVILVEPKSIGRDPHLHSRINYAFETNGNGHNLNVQLQKYSDLFAWRINGTIKKIGDRKSADYFLNNTGAEEANFSFQLEKSWKDKLFVELYGSTFNSTIGVLRGSHIGNLSDLEEALNRSVPFFTESDFSYQIESPKQKVSHHLLKLKSKYYFNDNQSLQFVLAAQRNLRKEFDVRRSNRTNIPSLNLDQFTFDIELKYQKELNKNWDFKFGNQSVLTDNTNDPETGILPLIPDYFSLRTGLFGTLSKDWDKSNFNIGIRYDYKQQKVVTISNAVPREIQRFENNFHNFSAVAGYKNEISKIQSLTFNLGYAMRNPAINELYSNGLHQGVSGIEEGDQNLNTEKATKATIEYKLIPSAKFSISSLIYYQGFNDYIFLNPQDEIRLTIRGAFPVFKYEQTEAEIFGIDLSSQFSISNSIAGRIKYSFIKGNDTKYSIPLVNIPPSNLFGSLTYRINKAVRIAALKLEEMEFEVNNRFVFKQNNLLESQDFVATPDAYNLVGVKLSTNIIFSKFKLRYFTKIDNLLNVAYRDYLNRQRYFSDDLGISATVGLNFNF